MPPTAAPSLDIERVKRAVEGVISPYIGPFMAKSSTALHFRKLGLEEGEIDTEQLEQLVERMARALRVLVGNDKTSEVVERIRAAVLAETEGA